MDGAHDFLKALAIVLCVAAVTTVAFHRLRQPVVLGYILATFLLKPLPEPSFAGQSEMNAGTSAQAQRAETAAEEELPPELRFVALKDKFRELEGRTGDIEGLVTSPEFRLRRDFRKMGEGGSQ